MLRQGVKDFYFDKKKSIWLFFFGFRSDKIEVNNVNVQIPPGELIQHYDVDKNGAPWILTTNGLFFSYDNNQWVKRNSVINPVQSSSLKFWVKNDHEFWVGGYAYVAYFTNNQWVELSFLTPQSEHEGPDEYETDVSTSVTESYKWGVINDTDGYSNLRRSPDGKSEVIAKILTNFKFKYYQDNNTDWWLIETERGTKGYLHKSRIQAL
jgi:ligand-binding sensor domain-containing protein